MSSNASPAQAGEPAVPPGDEFSAIHAAGERLRSGRFTEVPAMLTPWLGRAEYPDTYTMLAQAYVSAGRMDEAQDVLLRADARFPQAPAVWKALAVMLRMRGRPAEELVYRRKLVYLTPDASLAAYIHLAEASLAALKRDPQAAQGDLRFVVRKVSGMPPRDDERAHRLAFAQALFQLQDLQEEAYRQYAVASAPAEHERDVAVTWVPLHLWSSHVGATMRRAADQGRKGHRPIVAELRRVAVLPAFQWMPVLDESLVAISGFNMRRLVFRSTDPASPLLMHNTLDRAVLRLPRDLPVHPGPALLLGGMPQYYHHTIELLGSLAVAEALGVPDDLPLIVNDDLAPFQIEQFAMLGIGEERLIRMRVQEPMRFERLWVASRPAYGGGWIDPIMPAWYRSRLALPPGPGKRRLYLSRAGTDRRRLANEEALVKRLAVHGFETIRPETLSVREQVEVFSRASHIVGPSGAAFTNMIFAPPGARVVAINHRAVKSGRGTLYFDALAAACGHTFAGVFADATAGHASGRTIDADVEVDLDAVEAALA